MRMRFLFDRRQLHGRWIGCVVLCCGLLLAAACEGVGFTALRADDALQPVVGSWSWHQLAPLPDPHGFAGPYAGVSGGALIVAGGANFPGGRPWEGHPKVWHRSIFVLPSPDGTWKRLSQRLPAAVAYGAALNLGGRMICCGGGNAETHSQACFELVWNGTTIVHRTLPDMPGPNAFFAAASNRNSVFVAGGIAQPDADQALDSFWQLTLDEGHPPQWRRLPTWPAEGRMLATLGATEEAVFLFGGARLYRDDHGEVTREFLNDAWKFDLAKQTWTRIADLPEAVVAAPNPAFQIDPGTLAIMSGDSGVHFAASPPLKDAHPGFPAAVHGYRIDQDRWFSLPEFPRDLGAKPDTRPELGQWPPVTTNAVWWHDGWVVPTGEIRPGVRSNRIWHFRSQQRVR